MADTPSQQSPGLVANILAVAGFFILIVIIVWGAYHLLRLTGTGVSSLFSRFSGNSAKSIALTLPSAPAPSGKAVNVSWKYSPSENGTYAFLYQCKQGFRFDAEVPNSAPTPIPCGNAYTVGNGTSLSVIPMLSGTSSVEIPISVVFMPSATSSAQNRPQGTGLIVVVGGTSNASNNSTKTSTPPTKNETATSTRPKVTGPADLVIRIIAVGVIDESGMFVHRAPLNPAEISAVTFDIANRGGSATGNWYFTAQLPTNPMYSYNSPLQMNLAPGAHIENTLRYRPLAPGGGNLTILVDSTSAVYESNESNNMATLFVSGPTFNYPYQQPYVY